MNKDQVIEEFTKIPGVSRKVAEALYAAGIRDIEALKSTGREQLKSIEGIGPKALKAIATWQAEQRGEVPEAKQEIQVVEEERPAAEKRRAGEAVRVVEAEEAVREHKARLKPTLDAGLRQALHTRAVLAKHRPTVRHDQWWRYPKLERKGWRLPRGARNKTRSDMAYRARRPVVGRRGPALARGLHSSGFREVLVHRPEDLEGMDAATQAARIAAKVGARKRQAIVKAAEAKGIRVLNAWGVPR